MGKLMQEKWPWIEGTHALCAALLESLSDEELQFNPGGENVTLGALISEMGDVEYSYIQSLKTFQQDWSYHNSEQGLQEHVSQLKKWFQTLDEEMKATIEALSDEDTNKEVKRGEFGMPIALQLDVYLQALLIFLGKATIYFKAMNKALPQPVQEWIG
jgi:uncharacterized damage-inducible protein DinB